MVRYGIIGAGTMGQEHIRNIRLLGGCRVEAISEPNADMQAQASQLAGEHVTAFSNHRDMLAAGLCDALLIATPNDTHHDILLDVLATNLPILVEKPLCTTPGHCRDVIARAEGRAAPIWVAMEYRFMPPMQRLFYELTAGTTGTPRMMSIREHRYPFLEKVDDWNRFNERTGGTLVEKCCHFWDLMRFTLKSDPVRVFASAGVDVNHLDERYDGKAPDMYDNAFVVVDFESGARGMLDLCMFAETSYWQEIVSVTGAKARVDAKVPGPSRFSLEGKERHAEIEISDRLRKCVTVEQVKVDETVLAAGDHHGSTFYQHQRFRDLVIAGKGEPEVSLMDGLWSVIVGEAAEQSARTGTAVEVSL